MAEHEGLIQEKELWLSRSWTVAGAGVWMLVCVLLQVPLWQRFLAQQAGREAQLYFHDNELDKGLEVLSAAQRIDLLDAQAWFDAGEALMDLDPARSGEAQQQYAQAVLRDPANAIYQQRLGAAFAAQGDQVRARECFAQALKLDPLNITLHIFMARYFLAQKDQEAYDRNFDTMITIYKNSRVQGGPAALALYEFMKEVGQEELFSRIQDQIARENTERTK